LWVRSFDGFAARALPGTEGAIYPFWSADSRFLGFFAEGTLKRVEASGYSMPQTVAAAAAYGGTWNRDDVIIFAPGASGGLFRVAASGGQPIPVIYVRPFPDVDAGRWQVSTGGGTQPLWARNGRELFYRSAGAVMAVPVEAGPNFVAGNPTVLFQGEYAATRGGRNYDVTPDGRRFLMLKQVIGRGSDQDVPSSRFIVVENWFEELNRLVLTN
jgi:hypothetical protein